MSSMSHDNGVNTTLGDEPISKDSFLDVDENSVGGLNRTPSLVKPLVNSNHVSCP